MDVIWTQKRPKTDRRQARRNARSDPHRARRSPGRVKLGLISVVPYFEVLYVTSLVVTELFTILNPSYSAAHSAELYENRRKRTQTQSGKTLSFLLAKTSSCPSLGWAANGHPILGQLRALLKPMKTGTNTIRQNLYFA